MLPSKSPAAKLPLITVALLKYEHLDLVNAGVPSVNVNDGVSLVAVTDTLSVAAVEYCCRHLP